MIYNYYIFYFNSNIWYHFSILIEYVLEWGILLELTHMLKKKNHWRVEIFLKLIYKSSKACFHLKIT